MRLRTIGLMLILALAILAPLAVEAQQVGKVYRIGYLSPGGASAPSPTLDAFRQGLAELGWVEGQNLTIAYRWADGWLDRLPALAAELARGQVEVIVAWGPAIAAAQQATHTIPVVMGGAMDAVAAGWVTSLAHPGGNITGVTFISIDLMGKRLELFKEALPHISRLAFLVGPMTPSFGPAFVGATQRAAQSLGLTLHILEVETPDDIERAFSAMAQEGADALYVMESPVLSVHGKQIVELAAKNRLPTMFGVKEFVETGGLMSYGANIRAMWRRSAMYVDKILKGAQPADLPVEQPTQYELIINLKTAQALGLTIPPSILFQADEVIRQD